MIEIYFIVKILIFFEGKKSIGNYSEKEDTIGSSTEI